MAEVTVPAAVSMLRITRCRDPLKWYAPLVGQLVPNLGMMASPAEWRSREPGGRVNFVAQDDAVPVVVTVGIPVESIPAIVD